MGLTDFVINAEIIDIKRALNLPVTAVEFNAEDFDNVADADSDDKAEEEWICSKCGNKVGQFDKFCPNCGDTLEEEV